MDVDDGARAVSTNSTCETDTESHKHSNAMSVDRSPENGQFPSAITTETTVAEEQVVSRPRPNYHAKFILSGHTMSISSLKFSPDGSLLASSGAFVTFVEIACSDSILYRRKPPTRRSRFGTRILAKSSKLVKAIMRASTTLHGRPTGNSSHLRQTTRQSLFGTWSR